MNKQLIVLDPGFSHPHSHHLVANSELCRYLSEADWSVIIAASRRLDQACGRAIEAAGGKVVRHFETPCYAHNANSAKSETYRWLSEAFSAEARNLDPLVTPNTLLLVHTGFTFHLNGLAQALWKWPGEAVPETYFLAMFPPSAQRSQGNAFNLEEIRCRHAMQLFYGVGVRRNFRTIFATSCAAFRDEYSKFWPGPDVPIHPSVTFRKPEVSRQVGKVRFSVLLFLGCPKAEKGILAAAQFAEIAVPEKADTDFYFHFNDEFSEASQHTHVRERLATLADTHNNFHLLLGHLDPVHYDTLLANTDIICLFHQRSSYERKTSGVLWDGLRFSNVQWLVTKGTLLEQELTESGGSFAAIHPDNPSHALSCLCDLLKKAERPYSVHPQQTKLETPLAAWVVLAEMDPGRRPS